MRVLSTFLFGLMLTVPGLPAVAAEATTKGATPSNPGFLADYDRLHKAGRPRKRYLVYMAPEAEGRAVHAILLLPATIAPPGAVFEDVTTEHMAALSSRLDSRLRAGFSKHARIASDASGADVRLELAITQVGVEEKGRGLIDLVPLRLVTGSIRNVAQGKEMQAFLTIESRVLDAATGAVLRERLDHMAGEEIGRSGDPGTKLTLESLLPAADAWVEQLVKATAPELE